ncbi:MAG: glycoside hydrolase family 3 N-terminal domain-containing protein [Bacteroidota bacterium]
MPTPAASATATPLYRDAAASPEARANDLLARMTLEEKVAQMTGIWNDKDTTLIDPETGAFDLAKAQTAFGHGHGLGQVGRPSDAGATLAHPEWGLDARGMAAFTNTVQRFFLEHTRLGIPVFFHEECLHGLAAPGSTSFPQPIGLAATFNPDLVERLYAMAAEEARVRGTHQALTPVVDVARDPRWGRVEETFGEDPYLVARLGVAAVRGFQGDATFHDRTHVIATLKHFAAHGQPESGMNCAPVNVSERELREVFLMPFKEAIHAGGAVSVMASYNEIDGVPSHANPWLLRDVLRGEWGFDGFVVSDYYALWELHDRPDTHGHGVAASKKEAARLAIRAGVNIELPEADCYLHLIELVREGALREGDLDALVLPMLRAKFAFGLFDDPYVDPNEAERIVASDAHRALAREAATGAVTLLKNEGGVLPLDLGTLRRIAVVGPNANRSLLGGYSGVPKVDVTVLDGIRVHVGDRAEVLYAEGCQITVGGSWNLDAVTPSTPEHDRRLIAEAVAVASEADVIVLAVGGNEQTAREAWARNHMGDRTDLQMVGRQDELVEAMCATGKPVVVLLFSGRPLAVRGVAATVPALCACFYLGQETGHAVADVLFGAVNPSGKLPITFPRSVGHLPAFYNHKPSARRGYLFDDASPLFAFGYGLSYTTFDVANVRLDDAAMALDGATIVRADVTNTGDRTGTEVVQLYIRDVAASVTRPVKELKGFTRVTLAPGETQTVALPITEKALAFWRIDKTYGVEPGDFVVMVGTSSRDADLQTVTLTVVAP